MISANPGELLTLANQHKSTHVRVEILGDSGSWYDLTDLNGFDWVKGVDIVNSVDAAAASADVELFSKIYGYSLSPFITDPTINIVNLDGVIVDIPHRIKIYIAVVGSNISPASDDYHLVFHGYIESLNVSSETIKLECTDLSSELLGRFIDVSWVWGSGGGEPVEEVIQDIIDDICQTKTKLAANYTWNGTPTVTSADTSGVSVGDYIGFNSGSWQAAPYFEIVSINPGVSVTISNPSSRTIRSGSGASSTVKIDPLISGRITLYSKTGTTAVPFQAGDSPGWTIPTYTQNKVPVMNAIKTLAMQIGWELRYIWNSSANDFVLTLYEPDRAKSTPDHTFTKDEILQDSGIRVSRTNVRNYIKVSYGGGTSVAQDSASQSRYGYRSMEITEASSSQVDTAGEATTMATACLNDLKEPTMERGISVTTFWPVELGDLISFPADNIHSDSAIDLAVHGYSHSVKDKKGLTKINGKGAPSVGSRQWLIREGRSGVAPAI